MAELLEIGDRVFYRLTKKDDGTYLGSPATVVGYDNKHAHIYKIKIHKEWLIRTVWYDEIWKVSEKDFFVMCLIYEPAPFYKED